MTQLTLTPSAVGVRDDVEAGVLPDGTPFLTGRSLSRLCGVNHTSILRWTYDPDGSGRDAHVRAVLDDAGYDGPFSFSVTMGGKRVRAFPDVVCMAVLDYYAFEARGTANQAHAQRNHRTLARAGLRAFVYGICGYLGGSGAPPVVWQPLLQRIELNKPPPGFFSIFNEAKDLLVQLMRDGVQIDARTIPDISIGQHWAKYWKVQGFRDVYGPRKRYPHIYPDDHPQAAAEPEAWVYPILALGDFRKWLDETYVPKKLAPYLSTQVKKGKLTTARASAVLDSLKGEAALTADDD